MYEIETRNGAHDRPRYEVPDHLKKLCMWLLVLWPEVNRYGSKEYLELVVVTLQNIPGIVLDEKLSAVGGGEFNRNPKVLR